MRYIQEFTDELAGKSKKGKELLQWFKDRYDYMSEQCDFFEENGFLKGNDLTIKRHFKVFGLLNRAVIEARYLSQIKRTNANSKEVDFAKEIVFFLDYECFYYETVVIPNLFFNILG